jgi:hypothetical protein
MTNPKQYGKGRRRDEGSNESPMGGNDGGREEMIKIEGADDEDDQLKASSKTSSNHDHDLMMSVNDVSFGDPQSTFNSFSFCTGHFQQFLLKVFQLSMKALHMIRRAILATPASRMVGVRENIYIYRYIYTIFLDGAGGKRLFK